MIAFTLATLLYYLIAWGVLGHLPVLPGFLFVFLYTTMLPGLALARTLAGEERDLLGALTTSSLAGLAYLLLINFIWALFSWRLSSLVDLLPLLILPLVLAAGARLSPTSRSFPPLQALLALMLVLTFAIVLQVGPPLDFTKDTLDHVGYVGQIGETGQMFPSDAFYRDAGTDGLDLRKGLMHPIYALWARVLGLDALAILQLASALLAVLALAAVYTTSQLMSRSPAVALLAVVVFATSFYGGLAGGVLREFAYTNRFGFVLYLYFLAAALHYLAQGKGRALAAASFFAFAASACHVLYALVAALALAVMTPSRFLSRSDRPVHHLLRVSSLGGATLVAVAPYLLYRFLTAYHGTNELHSEVQGVFYLFDDLFTANPARLLRAGGIMGLLALPAAPLLWRKRRTCPALGFLVASYFTVPLILLNPLLLPPLHHLLSYLVFRLTYLCPFYLIPSFYLIFWVQMPGRWRSYSKTALAAAMVATLLFALASAPFRSRLSPRRLEVEKRNSYQLWSDGLAFLADSIPPGAVVVSDPLTSYSIPAFTDHFVICTLDQHAPPNDLQLPERIRSARDMMSPFVSIARTWKLLKENNVDYVVLNNRIPPGRMLHYWGVDKAIFPLVAEKFLSHPELFRPLYRKAGFFVLAVEGQGPLHLPRTPPEPSALFLPPLLPQEFTPVGTEAGEARIEGFLLPERRLPRGGKLPLTVAWTRREPPKHPGNYTVIVRLDRKGGGLSLGGFPAPKLRRKLAERLRGIRHRARSDHKIAGGFLSPDAWPGGAVVLDSTSVPIPEDLAPGSYGVFVKLMKMPDQPTYSLRDVISDQDTYQGIELAEIVVD